MKTLLNKKYLLEKAVSTDKYRPALKNILVEDGKAIATNGSILAVVPLDKDFEGQEIEPGQYRSDILPAQRKVYKQESTVAMEKALDCSMHYPDYRQVIPNFDNQETVTLGIDAELLLNLAQAIGATQGTGKDKKAMVNLTFVMPAKEGRDKGRVLSPLIVKPGIGSDDKAIGVIMPCRVAPKILKQTP